MVEYQLPKLTTRVRFPSSAPKKGASARGRPSLEQMTQTRPGLRFSLRFLVSQCEDAQARVRICAEERVKLACKRRGAKYSPYGEIPVASFTRPGLRFSLRFLVSQSEDAQARVRICAEERVKLACKRRGAKILAFGEIPVTFGLFFPSPLLQSFV